MLPATQLAVERGSHRRFEHRKNTSGRIGIQLNGSNLFLKLSGALHASVCK
jgi:hypothetical protein